MLLVAVLAVWFAIVFYEESRVETFVAHDTGETRLVIGFRGRTDDLFCEVDGCIASSTLWCCWNGESRHDFGLWPGELG